LINLSNHWQWAQVSPLNIQLQDDWAWVNATTILWNISGNKLNLSLDDVVPVAANLAYNPNIYSQIWWSSLRFNSAYPNYLNWLWSNIPSINIRQLLNYELLFVQTWANSTFTGYFAPEHPINLNLTFDDMTWTWVSNPINVIYENNEWVKFWEHKKSLNFTWGVSEKLSWWNDTVWNYLTWEMAKLFSGNVVSWENRIFPYDITWNNQSELGDLKQTDIAFKLTDNWAWVDSGTITVTITGNRRWESYTYVFTSANLALIDFARWDTWANQLNFLAELKNHGIYFDRQSRWWTAPVVWRESRYTITLSSDDLKQPIANSESVSFTRDMENLSCKNLDRCNSQLYFTYRYDGENNPVTPVVQTWVHPFLWQTLYVIASGDQVIYTWANENYIACNGAGTLWAPINIGFEPSLLANSQTNPYNNYQYSELLIKDGNFELSGNILILK
jgi:hypothetical protein